MAVLLSSPHECESSTPAIYLPQLFTQTVSPHSSAIENGHLAPFLQCHRTPGSILHMELAGGSRGSPKPSRQSSRTPSPSRWGFAWDLLAGDPGQAVKAIQKERQCSWLWRDRRGAGRKEVQRAEMKRDHTEIWLDGKT